MKKLEDYGQSCQNLAVKLKAENLSIPSITSELNLKFNGNLTEDQVKKFLGRSKNKIMKLIKCDKNYETKLTNSMIDGVAQILELNQNLWALYYDLRKNPEQTEKSFTCPYCNKHFKEKIKSYITLLKISQEILEQIKHQDSNLRRMREKNFNIKYSVTDLSKKISFVLPDLLSTLERKGLIKIIKKRLRQHFRNQNLRFPEDNEEKESEEEPEEIEA
jgi:DNA repair ATPase RecN